MDEKKPEFAEKLAMKVDAKPFPPAAINMVDAQFQAQPPQLSKTPRPRVELTKAGQMEKRKEREPNAEKADKTC